MTGGKERGRTVVVGGVGDVILEVLQGSLAGVGRLAAEADEGQHRQPGSTPAQLSATARTQALLCASVGKTALPSGLYKNLISQ